MRKIVLIFMLLVSASVTAHESSELNKTMKEMGHTYKLAVKAKTGQEMQDHLQDLAKLVDKSKTFAFKKEVAAESLVGLNKVLDTVASAERSIAEGDVELARQALLEIDELRKQYHELHEPPSIWELLFGGGK
ncbi:cytochrome b562 [Pseudoalteromonas piscicida]|uniref:Cytochrome b562 n=1 Tax=Pseudoalteromonas piscicida TaxID=43662 RepID=A0A2A5JTH0_PSEO7|nr:cytochrome b562 [Pseudoalteromonas piscicida]PCK32690.1 hypothetical protein CEX98_05570 [Pseudoalteromonas piscicida]